MKECEFCEEFRYAKRMSRKMKKACGVNTYFKAILHEYGMKNRVKQGVLNHRPLKLVYCPSCGRKL